MGRFLILVEMLQRAEMAVEEAAVEILQMLMEKSGVKEQPVR
jgi:hypothetical protein